MNNQSIPVNVPLLSGNEKLYVNECIDSGWISSEGPFVERFERELSDRVNRSHGVAVANGSAALDVAVAALGIQEGDEVILPSHTIISCALSIVRAGATPVLIDSEMSTWNMDVNLIEEKITNKTKAIMAVHVYGFPLDMDKVLSLAKKYKLYVIEDAAQMLGQTYKGKPCGSFGDISTFSFYPNKQITTGEGGMCLTNNVGLAERCRSFRNLCFKKEQRFVHEELGWNYRMSNLQAALGVAQLENLDKHVEKKRHVGNLYNSLISGSSNFSMSPAKMGYANNIYWVVGILLSGDCGFLAVDIMKKLTERSIGTRPFFYPLHLQPVLNKMDLFLGESYPISEELSQRGFYLPSGLGISDKEIERSADALVQVLK